MPHKRRPLAVSLLLICLLLITGCERYQLTLNEQIMYTPPALFTDFSVSDSALQNCLDQTIKDVAARSAEEVARLDCSQAGIGSLQGLERFVGLEHIDLSENHISDLRPLRSMSRLKVLDVAKNKLADAAQLLTLPALEQINLEQNSQLGCRDVLQLMEVREVEVRLPEHCR